KNTSYGSNETNPSTANIPKKLSNNAVTKTPINKDPRIFRAVKINVKNIPKIANVVIGAVTSPTATYVSSSGTTIPDIRKPKKAINKPIPAVIPILSGTGIESINNSLNFVNASNKNNILAKNTAPKTV